MRQYNDERWDFCFAHIDGKPHSTMVNLSLYDVAPIRKLEFFHGIEFALKQRHPENGMSVGAEADLLDQIEDFFFQHDHEHLRYVARQTGDGKRKFYFYASSNAIAASLHRSLVQAYPDYEISTFNFADAEWQTYFEDLYPNAMAWNEITNRWVYQSLEKNGDNLDVPRTIDHNVIFRDEKQAKEFEIAASKKGFTVTIETTGLLKKNYDLLLQRTDAPSDLDPITFELSQMAERYGGQYDGWGCFEVTTNKA